MQTLDLYYFPDAPCRAVMLTADAIGISLNLKSIDILSGEHLDPEFEQMNPQKTVPLLVDGDYKLSESRAIMSYLVDKYGKNDRLYPKNANNRAVVNQCLYFDIGRLYKSIASYYYPVAFKGVEEYDPEKYDKLKEAFEIFDKMLEGQDYAAGRSLTIADLTLLATVSTAEAFGFEFDKYKNVARWYQKAKSSAPGYRKSNVEELEMLMKLLKGVKDE